MHLALLVIGIVSAAAVPTAPVERPASSFQLKWLADLGSEAPPVASRGLEPNARPLVAVVPGSLYVFSIDASGGLQRAKHLPVDPSAPYGAAVTDGGVVLATKEGSLSLWTFAGADLALRWRRDLGERVSALGWDGGDVVFASTWGNRVIAASAADGRTLWSADVGGRAEAPPLREGDAVFVATKTKALVRLDAATGAVRWKVALTGAAVFPLSILDDRSRALLSSTWDGRLTAHELATGRPRWTVTLSARLAGPPTVWTGLVGVVTADGSAHLYDAAGQLRWSQPGAAEGPATLLPLPPTAGAARVLVVSRMLAGLDIEKGSRVDDYPKGAVDELKRRFSDAMLEGEKTFSEGEKRALLERHAFDIAGPLFGPARLFGPYLVFGTEEGWAYFFDAATARPMARYHAGQPGSRLATLPSGEAIATAGEEIFALAPASGQIVWRRGAGAEITQVESEASVGVLAAGRLHTLDPRDGVPRWSLRGAFRSMSSAGVTLLNEDGRLRVVSEDGRPLGDVLPLAADLLPPRRLSQGSWVAAGREGTLFGLLWQEPALTMIWDKRVGERLTDLWLAAGRIVVRTESGALVAFDETREEVWRVRLAADDRVFPSASGETFVVCGAAEMRVHGASSGEIQRQWKVASPAVGVDVNGTSLAWLDRAGGAFAADSAAEAVDHTGEIGVPLSAAVPTSGGFFLTTAAGDVGFVEFKRGEGR